MGVSGAGKSSVGAALAVRLGVPFVDADDLQPPSNVAKMAAGHPLDEADRRPWLRRVRHELERRPTVVCACSALTRAGRRELRRAGSVAFVDLVVSPELAEDRAAGRRGHFMGPGMVASQFEALEPPGPDEPDVASVDASGPLAGVLRRVEAALCRLAPLDRPPPGRR